MQKHWLALAVFMAAGAVLPAQQPAAPSAQDLLKLDEVLLQWEKSMTSIDTLEVTCNRTAVDKVFQTREVYEGKARFIKGQRGQTPRASLEMHKRKDPGQKNAPDVYEKYICTGTFVYVLKADQTAEIRPVSVERNAGADAVVSSGLQPGETVVTDGQIMIFPGAHLQVKNSTPTPPAASK